MESDGQLTKAVVHSQSGLITSPQREINSCLFKARQFLWIVQNPKKI